VVRRLAAHLSQPTAKESTMFTSTLSTSRHPHTRKRGWLHAVTRACRPAALSLAVLAAGIGGLAAPGSAWADVSVAKPVGQLFEDDGSTLSPAGERWLRAQVAQTARQPDQMVVVQIPGTTPALQRERADAIRQRLSALGVAPRHVYIEAAPIEAPRMAGL